VSQYEAGVCNIGPSEVARRRQVAYLGGALYISFVAVAIFKNFSSVSTIAALFPALIFSVGLIQSRRKFCLAYGLMGSFNFAKLGSLTQVEDQMSLKADRSTALSILAQSLGLALLLACVAIALNITL
jgi:hypothetical protein